MLQFLRLSRASISCCIFVFFVAVFAILSKADSFLQFAGESKEISTRNLTKNVNEFKV